MSKIESIALTEIEVTEHAAKYLRSIGENPAEYTMHRVTTYGEDGYAKSGNTPHVLFHAEAGRGAAEAGGDWGWTDADSAEDVAARYWGIDGKEMCN